MKLILRRLGVTFIVLGLLWGGWAAWSVGKNWLENQLAQSRTFGEWRLETWGFRWEGFLNAAYDGLQLSSPKTRIRIDGAHLNLLPFRLSADQRLASLKVQQVSVHLEPSEESSSFEWPRIVFPDVQLPLRLEIEVENLRVEAGDSLHWTAAQLRLQTQSRQSLSLNAHQIQGTALQSPFDVAVQFAWTRRVLDLLAELRSETDSVQVLVEAPADNLLEAYGLLTLDVRSPALWAPIPPQVPALEQLRGEVTFQVLRDKRDIPWSASLSVHSAPVWQIPALRWSAQPRGDLKGAVELSAEAHGAEGLRLMARAQRTPQGAVTATASLRNHNLVLGKRTLPADLDIENLDWQGGHLNFLVRTMHGSEIQVLATDLKTPVVQLSIQATETEPWMLAWTEDNLRPRGMTQAQGTFANGILRAHLSTSLPYAYHARADQVEVDLELNGKGIQIRNAKIRSRDQSYAVQGQVLWGTPPGHLEFEIVQENGGQVQLEGNLQGALLLQLDSLQLFRLPLADTSKLDRFNGTVSAEWNQNFRERVGSLILRGNTVLRERTIDFGIRVRQNGDSLVVSNLRVEQAGNTLMGKALALTPVDSSGKTGFEVLDAQVEARHFDLQALVGLDGTQPFRRGILDGSLHYQADSGFGGRIEVRHVLLSSLDSTVLAIPRLFLHAYRNQIQIMARTKAGAMGEWDNDAEVLLIDPLGKTPKLSGAAAMDHGGNIWFHADKVDTNLWKASIDAEGPWILPGAQGEIGHLRIASDWNFNPSRGLLGLDGTFRADSVEMQLGSLLSLPLRANGTLKEGILDLPQIVLLNDLGDSLVANLILDLGKGRLRTAAFRSDRYRLPLGDAQQVEVTELLGKAHYQDQDLLVDIQAPLVRYTMESLKTGRAQAQGMAHLVYRQPGRDTVRNTQSNPSLEGRVELERMLYKHDLDLRPEARNIGRFLGLITGFFRDLGKEKPKSREAQGSSGRPIELRIHITDTGRDSLYILTDILTIPLTVDLNINGSSNNIILDGDINAAGTGTLDMAGLATFHVQSLRVHWPSVALRRGTLDMASTKDLPYCEEARRQQTCPVQFNLRGPLTKPTPIPEADCGTESSPAAIYYAILLGCVPNTLEGEGIDGRREADKLAGRLLGGVLSQLVNQGLGGEYLQGVSVKWRYFDETQTEAPDSNYVRIPVSLDRWIPNLSFVMAYAEDVSLNPRYDRSIEVGLGYKLPLFDSSDIHANHLDPEVRVTGALVARRYHTESSSDGRENQIEKNLGLSYAFRFWEPCLLGIGNCSSRSNRPEEEDAHAP